MSWNEILVAFGGVAGIAAALAVFAKLVAEKSAEAALKRFEHSLKIAEQDHDASLKRSEAEFNARLTQVAKEHDWSLKRLEAEYGSSLKRVEETHKATVAFASALDVELRTQRTKAYAVLWCKTGRLPQWPRDEKLQYSDLAGAGGRHAALPGAGAAGVCRRCERAHCEGGFRRQTR
jgi:hypothetical protein